MTNNLTKTILIGLPGVGKTTLSDEIARLAKEKTGIELETVSSDMKFRAVRKDKNHPVTQKFMKENNIPESDFPLLIKTNDFIKKYGEPVFRDLESAVILDMLEHGEFEGKIPNLGGKAMLHEKTAAAFKQNGYQVVYLKADLKTITDHITKDFEAMLDGATITRSPTNGPIMEDLKEKFGDLAEKSPTAFMLERIEKMRSNLQSANPSKNFRKLSIQRQQEANLYKERIKERDRKALEVMTKRHIDGDPLYQNVADKSVFLSGEMKEDIALLCQAIGIEDLSAKAKDNDIYTNSIRSIISGIDEVVPYTYDDERYDFKQYFDPIMEKVPEYHQDREKLGKMEAFKKWELPARISGYELLRRAIEQKKNIYFDHGGQPICHRELLGNVKKMGYETTMFYIDCEPQTAIERVSNRERPFPAERMPERVALVEEQKKIMPQIVDHFIKVDNR